MKDIMDKLTYKGIDYTLIFNLNVLEEIQEAYGTLTKCLEEAYGRKKGEPSMKALGFLIATMVNEGIDIDNENATKPEELKKPVTRKQANRMLSDYIAANDISNVVKMIDDLMAKSLQGGKDSKNE